MDFTGFHEKLNDFSIREDKGFAGCFFKKTDCLVSFWQTCR